MNGLPTGHPLVELTLFPRHFNDITLNQRGIDVELTSVSSGLVVGGGGNKEGFHGSML